MIRGKPERGLAFSGSRVVVTDRLLILVADELDELGVREEALVHADREWFLVSRWIFDGYVDLQCAVTRPAEALRHPAAARQRAALHVEPDVVAEPDGLDDELVAFPTPDGVSVPPGLEIL